MKKIVYYQRKYIDKYRCIDYPVIDFVVDDIPAFKSGVYFISKKIILVILFCLKEMTEITTYKNIF